MFWINDIAKQLAQQLAEDELPHALLLVGRVGLGKRALAAWLCAKVLDIGSEQSPSMTTALPKAADFHSVCVLEDKKQISILQIRELTSALSLSSHAGGRKAVMIEPANLMNRNAANGLLKTLEEPTGNTTLVLVADGFARIPATVASRCSIVRIQPPSQALAEKWLAEQMGSENDLTYALELAGGAPLRALAILQTGEIELARAMQAAMSDLVAGKATPMQVASAWRKHDFRFVMEWLRSELERGLAARFGGEVRSESWFQDYVMDTRDLFCYLDQVKQITARGEGSYNAELALERLLVPWTDKLRGVHANALSNGVI